jgi:excisionase family DNA binding protein
VTRGFPKRPGSIKQGAELVSVSHWTIRRRIASGELTAYRLGKQIIRIDLDELEQLFSSTTPTVGSEAS